MKKRKERVPFGLESARKERVPFGWDVQRAAKTDVRSAAPTIQEQGLASAIGGRRQPGSGAFDHAKGDVKTDTGERFLLECKTTEARSLRVEAGWLEKINREAVTQNRWPALEVEIRGILPGTPQQWVAVPRMVLALLLERIGLMNALSERSQD